MKELPPAPDGVKPRGDLSSESPPNARQAPKFEAPYAWVSCRALDTIRREINQPSAIAVYIGLATIANSEQSPSFTCPVTKIAGYSCLGYRVTHSTLWQLEQAGLITIQGNGKSVTGSTYTLLTFCKKGRSASAKREDQHRQTMHKAERRQYLRTRKADTPPSMKRKGKKEASPCDITHPDSTFLPATTASPSPLLTQGGSGVVAAIEQESITGW